MGNNTEKKPLTKLENLYKRLSKEIKSDNFCYRKVGREVAKLSKQGARQGTKHYFVFWGYQLSFIENCYSRRKYY